MISRSAREAVEKMQVGDIFEAAGIEIIPAVYAVSGSSGVIKRHTFDYIEACFINAVKAHRDEIDGIYLMLHGASEVEGLGSGDHHILKRIRQQVGAYVPITIACDPHGNLCREYVEAATVIRSYRESPAHRRPRYKAEDGSSGLRSDPQSSAYSCGLPQAAVDPGRGTVGVGR